MGDRIPYISLVRVSTLLGAVVSLACAQPSPKGPALTLATHPRAADRYARLLMRELVDSNPLAVRREVVCEEQRLYDALGGVEGQLRILGVEDSVYRAPANRARFAQIEPQFKGNNFETGGPLCDSLRTISDRIDPIAQVDSAIKSR